MQLNSRQCRTLDDIFEEPIRPDIEQTEIETLLKACGADLTEGRGSRVRIALNGVRAVFDRPHPQKESDKGAVRSMRRFLVQAGIKP